MDRDRSHMTPTEHGDNEMDRDRSHMTPTEHGDNEMDRDRSHMTPTEMRTMRWTVTDHI